MERVKFMKKRLLLVLGIGVIMTSVIAIATKPVHNLVEYDENTTLALFDENGDKIAQLPSKDSGYTLDTEKSSCTNGSISWNIESWSPVVTVNNEVNGRVSCNLYFKKATDYEICVAQYGSDSIQCSIIAQLDTTGACPSVNEDGIVEVTAAESENAYLCSAPDDYGTSYYYRGTVENNYVKFAGFYWRIIRINGDGSIRMIYDGTSAHANNDSSTDRQIGTSAYNSSSGDNAYVGYMYGTVGASTYEETHANIHDSTIKTYIDEWYRTNLLGTEQEQYIADALFCNDRTFATTNTGTGVGQSETIYRGYFDNSITKLRCSQQNDRFTVNDEVIGNGDLTYAIGLITADELVLAGGYDTENVNYYLYTRGIYWSMSPGGVSDNASIRVYFGDGYTSLHSNVSYTSRGVRPVINLKPDSLKLGDGTANNPYTIENA